MCSGKQAEPNERGLSEELESAGTETARPRRLLLRLICPSYPAFNIYSRPAKVMTALGPICVATAVHDVPGWDVEVIDENNYRRGPTDNEGKPDHNALQRARPADVVGLYGGLTSTIPRLLEIAKIYKALGVRTIAGGQHFVEENVNEALGNGIDIVVIGEGEQTIGELLRRLGDDRDIADVRGIAYLTDGRVVLTPPREPITTFDELPIPDFSVLRYARMKIFPISGVRGCGMDCEFCTVKGRPRCASAERMMEQFASAHEKWRAKIFFVVDDLFGQNRSETIRLCQMLADYQQQVKARFSIMIQIRLDRAKDGELLQAMHQAGIRTVAVGYESPIAEELKAMNKRLDPEQMVAMTRLYHEAGFRVHGMFIFGYPAKPDEPFAMDTRQRVRRFRRFIRRARLDTVQVLLPVPLPGTRLTDRLQQQNRIYSTEHIGLEYYDGNFPLFEPDAPMTPEGMQAAIRKIMGHFYRPDRMFAVGLDILSFPAIVFCFHQIKSGWQNWYRRWRRNIYRAGGWLTLRRWRSLFKKGTFLSKLAEAKQRSQNG